MSALLDSLLDATRRAECAANDLAIGCSQANDEGPVGGGVINPGNGQFYPDDGTPNIDPATSQFLPMPGKARAQH